MKKTINPQTLLFALCMLFSKTDSFSQNLSLDSTTSIEISGRVLNLSDKNGNTYKTELVCNNVVLNSTIVQNHKVFTFSVPKNSFYSVRISKKGYITRVVRVYTGIPNDYDGLYSFEFNTELVEEKHTDELTTEAMDVPKTIVSYNWEMRNFYYNEKHTATIKENLFSVNKITKQ